MKLLIDVSYYNNLSSAQWDLLAKVVDGVIIRLSFGLSQDTMAQTHINNAKRVGLPFAGYHWVDPTRDFNNQIDLIKSIVAKYGPASLFNDYEQYWSDWAAYMRQDLAAAYATRFSPSQLNSYFSKFHSSVTSGLNIPVGSYSADWFINKYSPDMRNWVIKDNYWEARYLRYYDSLWWTAKQKELGKDFDINKMIDVGKYAQVVNGIGRQFETYIEINGFSNNIGYHLDWNVFTDEGYYKMFGVKPNEEIPIPVVPDVYVAVSQQVGNQALRLRTEPNTTSSVIVGEVAGTKLKIIEDTKLALPKIGVIGQWLNVIDPQNLKGFVAAWFVDLIPPVTKPPDLPPLPPVELIVAVSPEVGTLGLRLRAEPNTNSTTLAGEAMGTKLKVIEPVLTAIPKIGVTGQWLNVSDPKNLIGYVAAWYVNKVIPPPQASLADPLSTTELTPSMIDQKYKVVASALWVRDKPDGNKIGYLWKDEIINVTEIADKWAHCEKGWVYMTYIVPE